MDTRITTVEGETVYWHGEVASTMDIAEELADRQEEGIVVAETQSAGRGRYGRKWLSPAGGLYLSWARKNEPAGNKFLNHICSLAVLRTLQHFGLRHCKIKLPNDILISGRKIAGILIERKPGWTIISIGLNLNSTAGEIGSQAVSFKDLTGNPVDKIDFLARLVREFKSVCSDFCQTPLQAERTWSKYLLK